MDMIFGGARPLRGEVVVPPDKSLSHRAAILGALAHGRTSAAPFLRAGDCLSTLACLRRLGVEVRLLGERLEVEGKAAQVEARGIDFLKGRVAVGNVELEAVKGLDLEVTAGNIEGSLLLQEGTHQLRVSMGNAELNLLPGSSVRLSASVSLGNQEIRGLERNPNGGDRQIGEGRARLEVSVRMGNLEIKAR